MSLNAEAVRMEEGMLGQAVLATQTELEKE